MPTTVSSVNSSSSTVNALPNLDAASAAAFTRRLSSTVRRGQNPPLPSFASGMVPRRANGPTSNVIAGRSAAHLSPPAVEESPPRQNLGAVGPQDVCRDRVARKRRPVDEQHLESLSRQEHGCRRPAHRAPTTIASYIVNLRFETTLPKRGGVGIGRITQNRGRLKLGISMYAAQMRLCWYAQAVAPARLETPSLSKMLLTWRATVFSLMNSSSAMARFVLPAASRRSTCASRSLSEPTGCCDGALPIARRCARGRVRRRAA